MGCSCRRTIKSGPPALKGLETRLILTRRFAGRGNRYNELITTDVNFRTQFGTKCNFDYVDPKTNEKWDKCRVWSQEGIAFNVHQCMDDSVEVRLKLLLSISSFSYIKIPVAAGWNDSIW